jgi:hypothetical protein
LFLSALPYEIITEYFGHCLEQSRVGGKIKCDRHLVP